MCKQCDGPRPPGWRVFCSARCRWTYGNVLRTEARTAQRVAARVGRICERPSCDQPIPAERRISARYCSYACKKAVNDAAWRQRSPHYNRQYLYGISPADWEAMWLWQGGRCAICWRDDWPGKDGQPHADHDHETGRFRGILCGLCNPGLGNFRNSPALLRAAANYVEMAYGMVREYI